jgi:hypothetical protein
MGDVAYIQKVYISNAGWVHVYIKNGLVYLHPDDTVPIGVHIPECAHA